MLMCMKYARSEEIESVPGQCSRLLQPPRAEECLTYEGLHAGRASLLCHKAEDLVFLNSVKREFGI